MVVSFGEKRFPAVVSLNDCKLHTVTQILRTECSVSVNYSYLSAVFVFLSIIVVCTIKLAMS